MEVSQHWHTQHVTWSLFFLSFQIKSTVNVSWQVEQRQKAVIQFQVEPQRCDPDLCEFITQRNSIEVDLGNLRADAGAVWSASTLTSSLGLNEACIYHCIAGGVCVCWWFRCRKRPLTFVKPEERSKVFCLLFTGVVLVVVVAAAAIVVSSTENK